MRPKHLFYLLFFGIVAVCAGRASADTDTGDVPIAHVPEDTYQFEPVPEGTQVTHTFKIQNKGTAILKIEKVRTG